MNDVAVSDQPTPAADGEILVSVQPEGLLVGGDPTAVESYLARLCETAGLATRAVSIDKDALGNTTGLLTGAVSIFGQSGKFVQLHPDSLAALKVGSKIPGTDGFYRMMTRGSDGKFLAQLQWKPTAVHPQRLMSLQMVAVQLALKSAIAEVEDSVRRVEGKVDQVLHLAHADRTGNVLGVSTTVTRKVAYLERHGSLPDADWDAVAGLGPALNVTIEQLRNHVRQVLDSLNAGLRVQDRADKLRTAVDDSLIGETLSLLVVAEDSLYKWQRLRLARVESTQPDHLPHVIDDARELLAHHLAEDANLYQLAHLVIDEVASTKAIDGFRFIAVKGLARDRENLRANLDDFARARRHQVDTWTEAEAPGIRDAAQASVTLAKSAARQALAAAGQGLINASDRLGGQEVEKKPAPKKPPSAAKPGNQGRRWAAADRPSLRPRRQGR